MRVARPDGMTWPPEDGNEPMTSDNEKNGNISLRTMSDVPETEPPVRKAPASESRSDLQAQERIMICESMISHCAVAIFAIDRDHRVTHWNKACEELTGIPAEKVLGTSNHWKAFYDHERPCLSDLLIDGRLETMQEHYRVYGLSLIHISEPTRLLSISYAVFCLKKKTKNKHIMKKVGILCRKQD